jgi:DNA-binding response OmpR family regulator
MQHILIIEDDENICFLLKTQLALASFKVTHATSYDHFNQQQLHKEKFDLVIMDRMLPGLSGVEICSLFRKNVNYASVPILMLTALDQPKDIIIGLDSGADDYMVKPFDMSILLARIRALIRRRPQEVDVTKILGLEINHTKHEVKVDQEKIHLTGTEYLILKLLTKKPGHVFTREQLIKEVIGDQIYVTGRTIDTHVAGLRKKLKQYANLIETIRSVGYRFHDED